MTPGEPQAFNAQLHATLERRTLRSLGEPKAFHAQPRAGLTKIEEPWKTQSLQCAVSCHFDAPCPKLCKVFQVGMRLRMKGFWFSKAPERSLMPPMRTWMDFGKPKAFSA